MTLQFDHAIILVTDLEQGINHYRNMGFNPFFGGVHAGGKTHNALIVFPNGTYLELLAPTSPELLHAIDPYDRSNFLFLLAGGEGLGGYALFSDDLAADVEAMKRRGLAITLKPVNGRARPDGQELRWRTAIRDNGSMTPFFLQDETPRNLRVPDDTATTTQPNGIQRISGLTIAVSDLMNGVNEYSQMTGSTNITIDGATAHFTFGDVKLTLTVDTSRLNDAKVVDIKLIDTQGNPISIKEFL